MKDKIELLINSIIINKANLDHIASTGKISGTLYTELKRVIASVLDEKVTDEEIEKEAWNRYGEVTGGQYHRDRPHERSVFSKGAKWMRDGCARPEWVKVEEKLPTMNLVVLVWVQQDISGLRTLGYYSDGIWYNGVTSITTKFSGQVTHWQPLPNPPAK